MPVIGRLDGQVDDVIISPISKRRREEEGPADAGVHPGERDDPPGDDARPPTTQTPHTDESSAERDELPVWLL